MKTKTIIIILVVVIVLAAGAWIYLGTRPEPDTKEPAAGTPEADQAAKAAATVKMPLKQGSKGQLVKDIQIALNANYKAGLKEDGDWGKLTQAALKGNNLPVTIYWKEYSEITGYSLLVGGKKVMGEKKAIQENPWLATLPSIPFMPTPLSTAQMAYMANYYYSK